VVLKADDVIVIGTIFFSIGNFDDRTKFLELDERLVDRRSVSLALFRYRPLRGIDNQEFVLWYREAMRSPLLYFWSLLEVFSAEDRR